MWGRSNRVQTPTVLQMETVECGAAALGIVLGYHGRWVPLEELRVACGVSRDGVNAANIMRGGALFGLEGNGWKVEPGELGDLPVPFIVHWKFKHFLVVEGVHDNTVYLNDPAKGPRQVSLEEFDDAFTGVALVFEKGADFETGGERPSTVKGLGRRARYSQTALAFVLMASIGLVVPGLLIPTFSRLFVDYYLIGRFENWLEPLLIGMCVTAGLQVLLTWLQQHQMMRLETKLAVASLGRFITHALRLPMSFFSQRYAGEVQARSALEERLAQMLAGQLGTAGVGLFTIAFYILIMLQYDVVLTLVGVLFAGLNLGALFWVSRHLADTNQSFLAETGKLSAFGMQGLQMIETFKAGGTEDVLFTRVVGQHAKTLNAMQSLSVQRFFLNAVPLSLNAIAVAMILVLGGMRVMEGDLTVGMLVAFQGLMFNFLAPVSQLVTLGGQLQDAQGCLMRVDDLLNQPRDPEFQSKTDTPSGEAEARKLTGRVTLEKVTFGYSPLDPPLIEDFDLDIAPGARIALVGASGSGKSTLAKLVSGLYRPWKGRVLIDGRPMEDIPRETLRNSIAVVDQDVILFEGSVRDNLTMWDDTMSEERLVEAAQDADIHDLIASRPGSYDSRLTENGGNLSGGQRAKLELARALSLNPSILILDEATSSLDPIAEEVIMSNLCRRGCTCIIIAHRLSTVRDCDEIIVLENGKPIQQGDHAALIAEGGIYANVVEG